MEDTTITKEIRHYRRGSSSASVLCLSINPSAWKTRRSWRKYVVIALIPQVRLSFVYQPISMEDTTIIKEIRHYRRGSSSASVLCLSINPSAWKTRRSWRKYVVIALIPQVRLSFVYQPISMEDTTIMKEIRHYRRGSSSASVLCLSINPSTWKTRGGVHWAR